MSKTDERPYTTSDIVLVSFPFAEKDTVKLRPGIIVSVLPQNAYLTAFITSSTANTTPYDAPLDATDENGLKVNSVARMNRMTVVGEKTIVRKIGQLDSKERGAVRDKLQQLVEDIE